MILKHYISKKSSRRVGLPKSEEEITIDANFKEIKETIIIKKDDYELILNHCKERLPKEACGLIAGYQNDNKIIIEKVYLLTNVEHSNEHFSMDPKEQFAAVKDARANKLTIVGNFHSHPKTPARPSEEDKRLAYDPAMIYMILSLLDNEEPVLRAFHIDDYKEVSVYEIEIEN